MLLWFEDSKFIYHPLIKKIFFAGFADMGKHANNGCRPDVTLQQLRFVYMNYCSIFVV